MLIIPKKFHRVWIGPKTISDWACRWDETWREQNSSWEFAWWRDEDVEPLLSMLSRSGADDAPRLARDMEAVYTASENTGHRSDVLRLIILFLHGGVYIDADVESRQPLEPKLEPWLEDHWAFVGSYSSADPSVVPRVENALMGGTQQHPFFEFCLRMLPSWFHEHCDESVVVRTGPFFVTPMLHLWRSQHPHLGAAVAFLPNEFLFHPRHWESQRLFGQSHEEPVPPNAVTVHHNTGTW